MENITVKRCARCSLEKPIVEFNQRSLSSDGLDSSCRACRKMYKRTQYAKHRTVEAPYRPLDVKRPREVAPEGQRWCIDCTAYQPLEDFSSYQSKGKTRFTVRCKSCASRKAQAWYEANSARAVEARKTYYEANKPEVMKMQKAYALAHPRETSFNKRAHTARVRAAQWIVPGDWTRHDLEAKYEQQNGLCHWCKTPLDGVFHVDHIIPFAKGGSNETDNICCACPNCNYHKHVLMPAEFLGS